MAVGQKSGRDLGATPIQSKTPRRERSRSRTSATDEGGRRLRATHTPASPRREREAGLRPNRTLISPQAASPTDVEGDRFPALKSSATAVRRQPPSDEAIDSFPSATVPSLSQTFSDEDIDRFLDIAAPPPAGGAGLSLCPLKLVRYMAWWGGASCRPAFSGIFREFPSYRVSGVFGIFGISREFPNTDTIAGIFGVAQPTGFRTPPALQSQRPLRKPLQGASRRW